MKLFFLIVKKISSDFLHPRLIKVIRRGPHTSICFLSLHFVIQLNLFRPRFTCFWNRSHRNKLSDSLEREEGKKHLRKNTFLTNSKFIVFSEKHRDMTLRISLKKLHVCFIARRRGGQCWWSLKFVFSLSLIGSVPLTCLLA